MTPPLHIVILAAGEGTRMRSRQPKVLQPLGGRPMLCQLLETAEALDPASIHVVYGSGGERVLDAFKEYDGLKWVLQKDRLGTGHAVQQALPGITDDARVLVLYGDHPLVPQSVLENLLSKVGHSLAVITMALGDPTGYGRILRDRNGRISGIVEERDASATQREIAEVNTGILATHASLLKDWLSRTTSENAQGEFYLTDIFELAHADSVDILSVQAPDAADLMGANDRTQLAALERRFQHHRAQQLMSEGVTLMDPSRVDVRGEIKAGNDVVIDVNVVLEGRVILGNGVVIGPGSVVRDTVLGDGTRVLANSVLDGVNAGSNCALGPFARLRPGTRLGNDVRIGNFVETKKVELGDGSKASHLSYLGDAVIGSSVNIGAGTITCNYDGVNKYATRIGSGAFIGSDSQLVAPVNIGENATVGAGSTITKNVPAGELAVSRTRQTLVRGWKRPQKADKKTDGEKDS